MNNNERKIISTTQAPAAIGTYSQAVKVGDTVYFSGQIPLDPETGLLVDKDFKGQLFQAFDNLSAVAIAAGGTLDDIVKLNIYLTDLSLFAIVNEVMARCFNEPYPARAVVGVASLPKNAQVEVDGIMIVRQHDGY